jgi:flavodoxin I
MKVLVVYDSVYGNTEQVALAISNSLSSEGNIEKVHVNEVKLKQLQGLDYLIVGSPTHAFKPTKAIRQFLKSVSKDSLRDVKVAAFDTRISKGDVNSTVFNFFEKVFGYAAKPIAGRLMKKGGTLIVPPEGFFVNDTEGPLKDGEIERAESWAKQIIKS